MGGAVVDEDSSGTLERNQLILGLKVTLFRGRYDVKRDLKQNFSEKIVQEEIDRK